MPSKERILLTFTIYRSGEKIFPIIPALCEHYDVDVLTINQMSIDSPWMGDYDPRVEFYEQCKDWGANLIQGPGYGVVRHTYDNLKIVNHIDFSKYKLVLVDDNIGKWSWGGCIVLKAARKAGCITVGSPHGNHEFSRYNLDVTLKNLFDYVFVFGEKEKRELASPVNQNKLLPGGVPANDKLKSYKKNENYILVVANYSNGDTPVCVDDYRYKSITEKMLVESGILDLSKKYDKKIVIKEKSKFKPNFKSQFKFLEKKYRNVEVILDCKDDSKLISDAVFSVSTPSTLCFKLIQLGVPTVLLKDYGMTGNFENYDGLVTLGKSTSIEKELQKQINKGRDEKFLRDVLEGGDTFSSTQVYVDNIREIIG